MLSQASYGFRDRGLETLRQIEDELLYRQTAAGTSVGANLHLSRL